MSLGKYILAVYYGKSSKNRIYMEPAIKHWNTTAKTTTLRARIREATAQTYIKKE